VRAAARQRRAGVRRAVGNRAFGLALALNETGLIDWEDFRRR
jgi:hypothetical protein